MWELTYFTKIDHHDTYPDIDPVQPKLSAAGKSVVVTGGGTGIGKSIAVSFAKAGASSVAIVSRRAAVLEQAVKEIKSSGPNTQVIFATADATDKTSLEKGFQSIADQMSGNIDVLVSNAGSFSGPASVAHTKSEVLTRDFELNVVASLNAFQAFLPYAATDAHIYNISSAVGHMAPVPQMLNYSANKAAGIKLFDYIAMEHPKFHVVNVQPGALATEMSAKSGATAMDTIELPGHFVVWLASPEAAFLKSKFVWTNWDVKELIERRKEIESHPHLLRVNLNGVPM